MPKETGRVEHSPKCKMRDVSSTDLWRPGQWIASQVQDEECYLYRSLGTRTVDCPPSSRRGAFLYASADQGHTGVAHA
eukprot:1145263-Pelagomonas_calceolata.AAC.2